MLWRDEFCPELEDPTQIDRTPSSPEIGEPSDPVLADTGNAPPPDTGKQFRISI